MVLTITSGVKEKRFYLKKTKIKTKSIEKKYLPKNDLCSNFVLTHLVNLLHILNIFIFYFLILPSQ